jgi:surfeit locus 1 family protein
VAGIVIAVSATALFVSLGLWQLRRLDERRMLNATIEARTLTEPVPLGAALSRFGTDPGALAYRRVVVQGTYDRASEILVIGRTLNGRSGQDVLTPLATDIGTIGVNRGWVPVGSEGPPVPGAEPPDAPVEVVGVLLESQTHGPLGTPGPDGVYLQMGRIDLEALSGQWTDLLPVYLLLEIQDPQGGELPVIRPPPEPSEGSHLSYAIQWFFFAAIALIGFAALVYREAR